MLTISSSPSVFCLWKTVAPLEELHLGKAVGGEGLPFRSCSVLMEWSLPPQCSSEAHYVSAGPPPGELRWSRGPFVVFNIIIQQLILCSPICPCLTREQGIGHVHRAAFLSAGHKNSMPCYPSNSAGSQSAS